MSRGTAGPLQPHGTEAGARRHWRYGERPYEPCRTASNRVHAERNGGGDPYAKQLVPEPQPAARNALPIVPYQWHARTYAWAEEAIRAAEARFGAPEKDDGACWEREAG